MVTPEVDSFRKASVVHPEADLFLTLERSGHSSERPGLWDLPGGNVRCGELHEVAIIREILEGTALSVTNLRVVQVAAAFFREADVYTLFIGHSCRATNDTIHLTDEHEAYGWVDSQGFLALPSAPYLQRLVAQAIP